MLQTDGVGENLVATLENIFSLSLTTRPNELLFVLAITFQSILTFAGNTRSLSKKEASERTSNWVGSGLALKRPDWKGLPRSNPLAY